MKITNTEFIKRITTSNINFNVLESNQILPKSLRFEVEFASTEPFDDVSIKGLAIEDWFNAMIGNKLIKNVEDAAPDNFVCLDVENTSIPYICQTLFRILSAIVPENITLKSLKYD